MLYRTSHNPFLFKFNPFPHSSPRLQGMEFGDLKDGGAAAETAVEDNGGDGDDLFVDELLDFSNGYSENEEQGKPPCTAEPPPEKEKSCAEPPPENSCFESLHESELCVEEKGLGSLEWLSHFVEDSFSDFSLTGKFPILTAEDGGEPAEAPQFTTPVQTKARTKRARTGIRVWPVLSPSSSSTTSSSSSTSSNAASFSPPAKKQKKKSAAEGGGGAGAQPRRCSHCGVTKTPQWRAGPHGSKTLCNACGVRFKSGRLLPEYRPACSPTFSSELHSNNHRKVLEMRRKKEGETAAGGFAPPVRSF